MPDTTSAGATPVAGGATPPQTPAQPAPATAQPATSSATDDEPLGAAGIRALDSERQRAKVAERERDELKQKIEELQNATRTDAEKALAQARKEGAAEALAKADARVRRAEVRTALAAAGVNPALLDLAAKADLFAALKVNEEGEVEGLTAAVESFKRSTPDLFRAAGRTPGFDGGPRGDAPSPGTDMNRLIRQAAGRA
jgi:flagellar biosynthesis/type III secretory pathway protein FliH